MLRNIYKSLSLFLAILLLLSGCEAKHDNTQKQSDNRQLRYTPDGQDLVITNGTRRFNRALYGTNTAFRVECGDLPELALFAGKGMGGNFRLGIDNGKTAKWLYQTDNIETRYRSGKMIYTIKDAILGSGEVILEVHAQANIEGLIAKVAFKNVPKGIKLVSSYGGVTGNRLHRNGDLNVDPESVFYLKPENCSTNNWQLKENYFFLQFGKGKNLPDGNWKKTEELEALLKEKERYKYVMYGAFPEEAKIKLTDATKAETPSTLWASDSVKSPIISSRVSASDKPLYYIIQTSPISNKISQADAEALWHKAAKYRDNIAGRIVVKTPDPYINPLGGILSIAADAIWEYPTYMHGAIGWRMRLNGWRGPYTADPLGWHNRAKAHYSSYAESQVTEPASGPSVPDPKNGYARQEEKIGNSLFTNGYICRNPNGKIQPHHYDMNLVFIDGLLRHFYWTGDKSYIKEMWPVLERHLAWEKRNFDGDNDNLYDAYCCIWASDALEYNGGGVSHSSGYNYLANTLASELAEAIGKDGSKYKTEAEAIRSAMNDRLWLADKGWYAEFVDELGLKMQHESAALWTVYHTMDSRVPDPFQAYQMMRYVDKYIPHIKVEGDGLVDDDYYVMSTTNWMPYTWSINNVVMAENLHTALSYWQGGHYNEGYKLWKSTLLDAMYLGSSPGNFVQLSALDAARGECYRDFADEVGMTARSLVEGLFGITPDMLHHTINIQPGLPDEWPYATLETPDIKFDYKKDGAKETYHIETLISGVKKLAFILPAKSAQVKSITVNGKKANWKNVDNAIGRPQLALEINNYACELVIEWGEELLAEIENKNIIAIGDKADVTLTNGEIISLFDPQAIFDNATTKKQSLTASVKGETGHRTAFVKVTQNDMTWWEPVLVEVKNKLEIKGNNYNSGTKLLALFSNYSTEALTGEIRVNNKPVDELKKVTIEAGGNHKLLLEQHLMPGRNRVTFISENNETFNAELVNWNIPIPADIKQETVALQSNFNDKVTQIFENKYLSPRWPYPTLSTPVQGIGNWCHTHVKPEIIDEGLREKAGSANTITSTEGIQFGTPGDSTKRNILFTSQWDNYPTSATVALSGKASQAYLLMAGSTNPMQSRIINGLITVRYTDGSYDKLRLVNPDTWWPIEQDYFVDGKAFYLTEQMPPRLSLKTGKFGRPLGGYEPIKGFTDHNGIPGGAATVLNIPLNENKTLSSLEIKAMANEVVIGLMGLTLIR